jgi:hypothetical protein
VAIIAIISCNNLASFDSVKVAFDYMYGKSYRLAGVELVNSYAVTTTSKSNFGIKDSIKIHYNN